MSNTRRLPPSIRGRQSAFPYVPASNPAPPPPVTPTYTIAQTTVINEAAGGGSGPSLSTPYTTSATVGDAVAVYGHDGFVANQHVSSISDTAGAITWAPTIAVECTPQGNQYLSFWFGKVNTPNKATNIVLNWAITSQDPFAYIWSVNASSGVWSVVGVCFINAEASTNATFTFGAATGAGQYPTTPATGNTFFIGSSYTGEFASASGQTPSTWTAVETPVGNGYIVSANGSAKGSTGVTIPQSTQIGPTQQQSPASDWDGIGILLQAA